MYRDLKHTYYLHIDYTYKGMFIAGVHIVIHIVCWETADSISYNFSKFIYVYILIKMTCLFSPCHQ
jgi:hypothetical protein